VDCRPHSVSFSNFINWVTDSDSPFFPRRLLQLYIICLSIHSRLQRCQRSTRRTWHNCAGLPQSLEAAAPILISTVVSLMVTSFYTSALSISIYAVSPSSLSAIGSTSVFLACLVPSATQLAPITSLISHPFGCTLLRCRAIVMASIFL